LNFNLQDDFTASRLWVQTNDGQELIQLQPGWFACNWRRANPEKAYDRWSKRESAFRTRFTQLSEYLAAEGAGQPKIRQCEVTYINHILPSAAWSSHRDFSTIFHIDVPGSPYKFEQMSVQIQHVLEADGEPFGRLYSKITPAFGSDGNTPLYVFELTARGAPVGDGIDGAIDFLRRGREAIDRTFVALTTNAMHDEWGFQK
jgi:uncharacterized protein (TIGR04255 family)